MRILWVKAGKLLPVDTGGKIRSFNILRHLARGHDLTLLSYCGGKKHPSYETEIQREFPGAIVLWTAALDGNVFSQSVDYLRRVLDSAPFAVGKFTHPAVRQKLRDFLSGEAFDVAVCDFLSASLNFPGFPRTPTVLFQHNFETALWRRMASTESNWLRRAAYRLEAAKMAHYEPRALKKFHHVIAVSGKDRQLMLEAAPACAITVVATGVDTQKYALAPPASATPPRLVFLGSMDWEPNIDAVIYFCQEIFPAVRNRFPSALFQIVGRNPHPSVKRLASDHVQVTGTVPSIEQFVRDATLVVVPLRIGGGTRLKIFEAMAMGRAVVSSSIGAEGLEVQRGRDLILADDPASFAEAVCLLIRDPQLRQSCERAAAKLAAQYDWSRIAEQFAGVLQQIARERASEPVLPHAGISAQS